MTRDEYYSSDEFKKHRLLCNMSADLKGQIQEIVDMCEFTFPENWSFFDKYCMISSQLKVITLEVDKLWEYMRRIDPIPAKFEEKKIES